MSSALSITCRTSADVLVGVVVALVTAHEDDSEPCDAAYLRLAPPLHSFIYSYASQYHDGAQSEAKTISFVFVTSPDTL